MFPQALARTRSVYGITCWQREFCAYLQQIPFDGGPAESQVSQHIPDKGFQLVRYYGWYSNKARGVRAKTGAAQAEDSAQGHEPDRAAFEEQHLVIALHPLWCCLLGNMHSLRSHPNLSSALSEFEHPVLVHTTHY
jgi:hypothetical protein